MSATQSAANEYLIGGLLWLLQGENCTVLHTTVITVFAENRDLKSWHITC